MFCSFYVHARQFYSKTGPSVVQNFEDSFPGLFPSTYMSTPHSTTFFKFPLVKITNDSPRYCPSLWSTSLVAKLEHFHRYIKTDVLVLLRSILCNFNKSTSNVNETWDSIYCNPELMLWTIIAVFWDVRYFSALVLVNKLYEMLMKCFLFCCCLLLSSKCHLRNCIAVQLWVRNETIPFAV